MNEQVTRQILWNIPVPFIVLMYSLLGLLIAGFIYAGFRWYRLVSLGVSDNRLDHPIERLLLALRDSFGPDARGRAQRIGRFDTSQMRAQASCVPCDAKVATPPNPL